EVRSIPDSMVGECVLVVSIAVVERGASLGSWGEVSFVTSSIPGGDVRVTSLHVSVPGTRSRLIVVKCS
ncbi:hypothetical protein PMAYCL1PPCAC_31208, partial [Pristionchus mayeri]